MTDRVLPKAIICDLDGTLALLQGRDPFDASKAEDDALNNPVANLIEIYAHQSLYDIRLIFITGRQEKYRKQTEKWLAKHTIHHFEKLYMRNNRDYRKDTTIKKEIYEKNIKDTYDVLFVLEDRDQVVKMWRDEGLSCFQVNYGNF